MGAVAVFSSLPSDAACPERKSPLVLRPCRGLPAAPPCTSVQARADAPTAHQQEPRCATIRRSRVVGVSESDPPSQRARLSPGADEDEAAMQADFDDPAAQPGDDTEIMDTADEGGGTADSLAEGGG